MALPGGPGGGGQAQFTTTRLHMFLNAALSAVGQPYVWGGNNLSRGVDCSGLVYWALKSAGYSGPRTASSLADWTQPVANNQAKPGDLVYWDVSGRKTGANGIDHVGIYLGNGKVLEASSGQKKVVIRNLWGNYRFGRVVKGVGPPQSVPLGNSGINVGNLRNYGVTAVPPASGQENSTDPYNPANTGGGGGGISTAGAVGPPPTPKLAANASEAEIIKFIEENYGPSQIALLRVPELRAALLSSARAGIVGVDRFMVEIEKTKWWQSRSESMRTFDLLELTNPKEAAAQIARQKGALGPQWSSYGVDADIDDMAKQVIRLGLNEQQIAGKVADSLLKESRQSGLDPETQGAADTDELIRIARMEYLTPIDRMTAERWAIRAIREGGDVEEMWRSWLAAMSSTRFGIDPASGVAPGDVMAPVRMAVAESLEINPEEIDLLNPKYADLLQVETSDGRFRPMTANEATKWARSQEEFSRTSVANEEAAAVAEGLAKRFGKVA